MEPQTRQDKAGPSRGQVILIAVILMFVAALNTAAYISDRAECGDSADSWSDCDD